MEYEALSKLMDAPERPYVAIVSGAKVETKVAIISALLQRVDKILVGGRIANTFLAAKGCCESESHRPEDIDNAKKVLAEAGDKLVLPLDVVISRKEPEIDAQVVDVEEMPDKIDGVWDLGPKTISTYLELCKGAKSVMWNGPVGKFEVPAYEKGTYTLAKGLAKITGNVVVGGGDTVHALEQLKLVNEFHHVSVGGGAMIAFLEGAQMPGLEPLMKQDGGTS
jgi:phosphoglycerate kinase